MFSLALRAIYISVSTGYTRASAPTAFQGGPPLIANMSSARRPKAGSGEPADAGAAAPVVLIVACHHGHLSLPSAVDDQYPPTTEKWESRIEARNSSA